MEERAAQVAQSATAMAQLGGGTALDDAQRAELMKVFGPALDLGKVQIVKGPAALFSSLPRETPAFTVGNRIIVNPKYFPPPNDLLVHESTHVWQFQTSGLNYLPQALTAQWLGEGYDYARGISEGKQWSQLNPEQQAEFVQEAYAAGAFEPGSTSFVSGGIDYSSFLASARDQIAHKAGGGRTWDFSRVTGWLKSGWHHLFG